MHHLRNLGQGPYDRVPLVLENVKHIKHTVFIRYPLRDHMFWTSCRKNNCKHRGCGYCPDCRIWYNCYYHNDKDKCLKREEAQIILDKQNEPDEVRIVYFKDVESTLAAHRTHKEFKESQDY